MTPTTKAATAPTATAHNQKIDHLTELFLTLAREKSKNPNDKASVAAHLLDAALERLPAMVLAMRMFDQPVCENCAFYHHGRCMSAPPDMDGECPPVSGSRVACRLWLPDEDYHLAELDQVGTFLSAALHCDPQGFREQVCALGLGAEEGEVGLYDW